MCFDAVIRAAVAEYRNSFAFPHWSQDERLAARAAVRGMMVRLDRYDDFCLAIGLLDEARDAVS